MQPVYTTIQAFLDSILGTYTPMVYQDSGGTVSILQGLAGVDWPYLIRASVILITFYAVFKVLGSIIAHAFK